VEPQAPLGELTALTPDPLAVFRGLLLRGRQGKREGRGREGTRRGK